MKKVKQHAIDLTDEQYASIKYFKSEPEMGNSDMKSNNVNKSELTKFLVSKSFNKARVEKRIAIL